jgi:predicted exporter
LLGAGIVVVLVISVLKPAWTDDMSAVSPVSPARLQADQQLRHQLGAPDIRSVIAIRANELQTVLEQTEEVVNTLDLLIEQDALSNYQSVAALVPSERTQRERRRELNAVKNLAARMEVLSSEQGFRPNSFQPFVDAVNSVATSQQLVTPEIYADTDLATLVAGSLYERDKEWISIVALFGLQDRQQLIDSISATVPGALFVDLKDAANSMMARYRIRVVEMLLLALAVIAVYLVWSLRNLRQVIWVLGTLAAALLVTIAGSSLILGSLSIFNLIAAVLVAGLGMDYALFFARTEASETARENTAHAVGVCALSTCAAFTILAFSSIPVLQSIGVTVAIGVAACYGFARLGSSGRRPGRLT